MDLSISEEGVVSVASAHEKFSENDYKELCDLIKEIPKVSDEDEQNSDLHAEVSNAAIADLVSCNLNPGLRFLALI